MKSNKNLISYALGISLLVCGYSIFTSLNPAHRTGVCSASESISNPRLARTVSIIQSDRMAAEEFFLPELIESCSSLDSHIDIYRQHTETLEDLKHLEVDQLIEDIAVIFARNGANQDIMLLKYRILEMEIFQAFRLFVSMNPRQVNYTWKEICGQLCTILREMQTIPGNFKNPIYGKLLTDLESLISTKSKIAIGWVLKKYLPILPKSIQNKCGFNLSKLIKFE